MLCMCIYIFLFPFLIWTLGLKFCETFKLSFPLISYFGLSTTHFEESPTLQCFSVPNCLIFLICLLNLTCCLSTLKYIISFNCYILLVFLVRFWVAVISLLSIVFLLRDDICRTDFSSLEVFLLMSSLLLCFTYWIRTSDYIWYLLGILPSKYLSERTFALHL